jgi:hypothetical protein
MHYIVMDKDVVNSPLDVRQPHATVSRALDAIQAVYGEVSFSRDAEGTRVTKDGKPLCRIVYREKKPWPELVR